MVVGWASVVAVVTLLSLIVMLAVPVVVTLMVLLESAWMDRFLDAGHNCGNCEQNVMVRVQYERCRVVRPREVAVESCFVEKKIANFNMFVFAVLLFKY